MLVSRCPQGVLQLAMPQLSNVCGLYMVERRYYIEHHGAFKIFHGELTITVEVALRCR